MTDNRTSWLHPAAPETRDKGRCRLSAPASHSHSEHRVCTVLSRQQIRSHHTPHHSLTHRLICPPFLSNSSLYPPLFFFSSLLRFELSRSVSPLFAPSVVDAVSTNLMPSCVQTTRPPMPSHGRNARAQGASRNTSYCMKMPTPRCFRNSSSHLIQEKALQRQG